MLDKNYLQKINQNSNLRYSRYSNLIDKIILGVYI